MILESNSFFYPQSKEGECNAEVEATVVVVVGKSHKNKLGETEARVCEMPNKWKLLKQEEKGRNETLLSGRLSHMV